MTTTSRYTWGGDEHLVVQLSEEMSLQANFQAMSMGRKIEGLGLAGVTDVCPSNASLLIRFDPDVLDPATLERETREVEREIAATAEVTVPSRIVEIPVWYDDPFTNETAARFRDRHQMPDGTDLQFAARENGMSSVGEFIAAHSGAPWIASMVGFVAGLPFLYQMVEREQQIEVPKYIRPRTDTPALTIGHGGCFSCIYSVRGAGGYQMFGVTPVPIFEPAQTMPDFSEFMVFFRPGDVVKFRPVDGAEYEQIGTDVAVLRYHTRQASVDLVLSELLEDPASHSARLLEALHGH